MSGAGGINIATRHGTDNLHGAAFFFYRDHNMAAYSWPSRTSSIRIHFLCESNGVSDLAAL